MLFRPKKNRRKVDLAKKTGELKAAARQAAPTVLKVILSACLTAALVWGGLEGWKWATTSPTFAITDITVTGNTRATDAQLARLGGVEKGMNLVALDTSAVERAIHGQHPWVKAVTLTRRFPTRLSIDVVEHQPVATVALGDLYLVSDDATLIKGVRPGEGVDLPLITGLDRDELAAHKDESLARVQNAVDLLKTYQANGAAKDHPLSELHLAADGVTLVTTAGEEIVLGEGDVGAKLARLARVRAQLASKKAVAQVIHLENRARPGWVAVQLDESGIARPADKGAKQSEKGSAITATASERKPKPAQ